MEVGVVILETIAPDIIYVDMEEVAIKKEIFRDSCSDADKSSPLLGNSEASLSRRGKPSTSEHERIWATALASLVAAIPTLLVGFTIGYSSAAVLQLQDLGGARHFSDSLIAMFTVSICASLVGVVHFTVSLMSGVSVGGGNAGWPPGWLDHGPVGQEDRAPWCGRPLLPRLPPHHCSPGGGGCRWLQGSRLDGQYHHWPGHGVVLWSLPGETSYIDVVQKYNVYWIMYTIWS